MTPYQAARESAVLFNLRDRAQIELAGRDAREFLHNLCTQDVKSLSVGGSCEAFLTTSKARVIAHLGIWHRTDNVLLLDCAGSQAAKVVEHLNHHLISEQVEISPPRNEFVLLRVIGPKAVALLTSVGLLPARQQPLAGVEGCDVFLGDAGAMSERILNAGIVDGDPETYHLLRIEAGMPEFGIDIDEDRLAMEVNRPQSISYTKGCYLGQETIVMARDRGQINRKLMGLKFAAPNPVAAGTKLFRGSDEVGQVTSSVFSPGVQRVIGLAYLRRGSWDAGMELALTPAGDAGAVVSSLPFLPTS